MLCLFSKLWLLFLNYLMLLPLLPGCCCCCCCCCCQGFGCWRSCRCCSFSYYITVVVDARSHLILNCGWCCRCLRWCCSSCTFAVTIVNSSVTAVPGLVVVVAAVAVIEHVSSNNKKYWNYKNQTITGLSSVQNRCISIITGLLALST